MRGANCSGVCETRREVRGVDRDCHKVTPKRREVDPSSRASCDKSSSWPSKHFQGIPGQVLEKILFLTSSCSPFDHQTPRPPPPAPRFQTRLPEHGAGLAGGEGAKLGDIYPTTFGEHFENAETKTGLFCAGSSHSLWPPLKSPNSSETRRENSNHSYNEAAESTRGASAWLCCIFHTCTRGPP